MKLLNKYMAKYNSNIPLYPYTPYNPYTRRKFEDFGEGHSCIINYFFLILKIPLIPDEKYEDLNKSMTKYKSNISLCPYTPYTPYTRSKI